jgi:hypothetical protein
VVESRDNRQTRSRGSQSLSDRMSSAKQFGPNRASATQSLLTICLAAELRQHGTVMSTEYDPSAALASVLAILAQTKQKAPSNLVHPQSAVSVHSRPLTPANLDPVFAEGDILDTSQWIGALVTPWYEPRPWQFPRFEKQLYPIPQLRTQPGVTLRTALRPVSPPVKQKRPPSPDQLEKSSTAESEKKILLFPTYSHAIKHVVRESQSEDFILALRNMKTRQNNLESDLFEERSRIKRSYESKLKMDQLLQSLGSQYTGEKVPPISVNATDQVSERAGTG